jgi:putative ABC transport system ATP-binding protein
MAESLSVRDLTVDYRTAGYAVRALDSLSLALTSGELVAVLGASGCGKTTLLSTLAGLLSPSAGSIRLDDREITSLAGRELVEYRRHQVGVAFQSFNLIPSLTVAENVAVPLWTAGVSGKAAGARAVALLGQLGLAPRAGHRANDLSSGEQQRVAFARALANDPELLLADEPTAYLDRPQVAAVLQLLRDVTGPGRMVIVASHDERVAEAADRVVELSAGAERIPRSAFHVPSVKRPTR